MARSAASTWRQWTSLAAPTRGQEISHILSPVPGWRSLPVRSGLDPCAYACHARSWMLLLAVLVDGWRARNTPADAVHHLHEGVRRPPRGGRTCSMLIEGRVTGARPDQRLVLYARSSVWWVKPDPNIPYTEIRKDSTFSTKTHLGTDYAALPVDEPSTAHHARESTPRRRVRGPPRGRVGRPEGESRSPHAPVRGLCGGPSARPQRSRRAQPVRSGNAWTDADGAVHLRIAGAPGRWMCAELTSPGASATGCTPLPWTTSRRSIRRRAS